MEAEIKYRNRDGRSEYALFLGPDLKNELFKINQVLLGKCGKWKTKTAINQLAREVMQILKIQINLIN